MKNPLDSIIPRPVEISDEDRKYLDGKHNLFIRLYFYLERGLDILNIFRNLVLGLLAGYFALKIDNYALLVGSFIASFLILIVVGWYNVHRLMKTKEWLGTRFSTHYGLKAFNYQAEQVELLKDIRDMLETGRGSRPIAPGRKEWLIWSNEHDAWWGPNHRGYTKDRAEAGRYTYHEACAIVEGANKHRGEMTPNEAMILDKPLSAL